MTHISTERTTIEGAIEITRYLRQLFSPETRAFWSRVIIDAHRENGWVIPQFVHYALDAWHLCLSEDKVQKWLRRYEEKLAEPRPIRRVGVVLAGNIPLVGLHDVLCVLVSGHTALVKLSQKDTPLMKFVLESVRSAIPWLRDRLYIVERLREFDAVIATGSNATALVFRQYFSAVPHIIRHSRTSIAVLLSEDDEAVLRALAEDVFVYFGLGCRNVTKLYLPEGFSVQKVIECFRGYEFLMECENYRANYEYFYAGYSLNKIPYIDAGFFLLKPEQNRLFSPVSVLFYDTYRSVDQICKVIEANREWLQCVVTTNQNLPLSTPPGTSQLPQLWDYPDHTDTLSFLLNLH